MPPDERSPHVIRACVQEQKALIYDVLLPLHAAGLRPQRRRRAEGSGGGVLVEDIVASRPQRALRPRWPPRGRIGQQALSKAAGGLQWLTVGGTSAVGGHTATLGFDGVHWAVLLEWSRYVP